MSFESKSPLIVFYTREGKGQAGAEVRSLALCGALRKKGTPAFVLSFRMFHPELSETRLSSWQKIKFNAQALWRLFVLRPDILVLQRVNFHLPAALVYLLLFRPVFVLDVDDWEFREDLGWEPLLGITASLGETCLRFLCRWAQTTVTASFFLEEHLKIHGGRTEAIPSGIDTRLFGKTLLKKQGSPFRCVWTGSLDLRSETLEEITELASEFSRHAQAGMELWLVARGEKLPSLEESLRSLNSPRIRLFSSCSRKQVAELLAQCDAGLLPLFSNTRFNRAKSPVKLFEYLASGLIPLCANRGEAPRIIRHGENGFLADNAAEMMQTLNRLVQLSPEERGRIQENAKSLASLYSLERASESWSALFQNNSPVLETKEIPKCFQAASVAQRP